MKLFLLFNVILVFFSAYKQIQAQQHQNGRHRSNYNQHYNSTAAPTTVGTPNGKDEIMNGIYNQMLLSSNNNEKQYQKLENLENVLQRFELRNRDQLDVIRNEIKEIGRRMQNLDWIMSRNDGNLNQLRGDLDTLRHSLTSNGDSNVGKRDQQSVMSSSSPPMNDDDIECSEKLEALATLLTSTRSAVFKLERQTNEISNNVSSLLHTSRDISQRQFGLPTKQYLHSALNSLRPQSLYGHGSYSIGRLTPNGPLLPESCAVTSRTGINKIQVSGEQFYVACDAETEGGGWTVIQNREDGTINFNRNWLEYKYGFGNLAGEFFIGLDKLHSMTSTTLHELLIVLEDFDGTRRFAKYKQFAIAGEKEDYALRVLAEYEGDAGDSLSYSASYKFSTFDNDNDGWVEGNCALAHTGAWWYNACEMSNLNGQYLNGELSEANIFQGVYWNDFRGPKYSLKSAKMMIRPIDREFLSDLS